MRQKIEINRRNINSCAAKKNTANQNAIKDFYDDSTIFITGGTGFIGKVLVEKLLRSFENIKEINLLIRTKKGKSSENRLNEYIKDQVFDRVRRECPETLKKIKPISGDIKKQHLGLDDFNHQKLINNVNIVFNSAATVKFDVPLNNAININTLGTERVMDLCSKMLQLKTVVHVSTAFCYITEAISSKLEEKIYPLQTTDKDYFLKRVKNLNTDCIKSIPDKFQESHPNTYTLSKLLAEEVIYSYSKKFPISIIRPSIVSASIEEPVPGFVDNVQAFSGVVFAVSRGFIRVMACNKNCLLNLIPVDVVAKQMIAAAWRAGTDINPDLEVYNCVSHSTNPLSFDEVRHFVKNWSKKYPSQYVIQYPMIFFLTNPYLYNIFGFLLNKIPAIYLDILLKLRGSIPTVLKNTNKILGSFDTFKFGLTNTFYFRDENSEKLSKLVANTTDGKLFSYDLKNLNWEAYVRDYVLGLRRYVSREDDSSLPESSKKLRMLISKQILVSSIFMIIVAGLVCDFGVSDYFK